MYKLIDKIPENIPEDRIEKKIINYTLTNTLNDLNLWGSMKFHNLLCLYGFANPESNEYFPSSNDTEIKCFGDFYWTGQDSMWFIPKKWIDGKKEVFIYDDSDDEYFHLIVGEYKEKL